MMAKFEIEIQGDTFIVDGADEDEALQAAIDELCYTIYLVDEHDDDDEDEDDSDDEDEEEDFDEDED